jgi:serpin B
MNIILKICSRSVCYSLSLFSLLSTNAIASENEFAYKLYHQLDSKPGNLFFSPLSVSIAMAMPYVGARGTTAESFRKVFGYGLPPEEEGKSIGELIEEKTSTNKAYTMRIADTLWVQSGFIVRPAYASAIQTDFGAKIQGLDFKNAKSEAANTINNWATENSLNKLPSLWMPSYFDGGTPILITNAVYFKAKWKTPFPARYTKGKDFHLDAERTIQVLMMHEISLKCKIGTAENVSIVELPYENSSIVMDLILPQHIRELVKVEKRLSGSYIKTITRNLKDVSAELWLPKAMLKSRIDLTKPLEAMGLSDSMKSTADFGGISEQKGMYIGGIIQSAFVGIDEEGTEAGAVTMAKMHITISDGLPYEKVTFNHPYVLLIRDTSDQTVLFMGRIADPSN